MCDSNNSSDSIKLKKIKNDIRTIQQTINIIEDTKTKDILTNKVKRLQNEYKILEKEEYLKAKLGEFRNGIFRVKKEKIQIILNDYKLRNFLVSLLSNKMKEVSYILDKGVFVNITDKHIKNFLEYNNQKKGY